MKNHLYRLKKLESLLKPEKEVRFIISENPGDGEKEIQELEEKGYHVIQFCIVSHENLEAWRKHDKEREPVNS